jgi:hypothetical protein
MSLWHVNLHRYLELFPCPHTIHVDLAVWPVQIWGKRHKDPDLRWSRLTTKLTQIGWLGPMRRRWCGIESPVVINGLSYNLWKVQNLHTSLAHKDNENFEFVWIQIVHFFPRSVLRSPHCHWRRLDTQWHTITHSLVPIVISGVI